MQEEQVMKEPRKMDLVFAPCRLYAPDILMFSTGSQEYLTVGLLRRN